MRRCNLFLDGVDLETEKRNEHPMTVCYDGVRIPNNLSTDNLLHDQLCCCYVVTKNTCQWTRPCRMACNCCMPFCMGGSTGSNRLLDSQPLHKLVAARWSFKQHAVQMGAQLNWSISGCKSWTTEESFLVQRFHPEMAHFLLDTSKGPVCGTKTCEARSQNGVLTPHMWLGRPSHRHGEAHAGITVDLGEFLHDQIRAQWQLPKSMVRIRDHQNEATLIQC